MTTFNSQNFKIGPCAVIFKGDVLGISKNASVLKIKSTYHDSKCSRAYQQALEKRLTSMTVSFTTEIMSIDKALGLFFDENDCITLDRLGERQSPNGGELLLIPINPSDMIAYRFPNALPLLNGRISFNNNEEYTLKLEFEANYLDNEEVLFERIPVDEAQRVSLTNTNSIDTAALERAMTAYIASKLNMTVDADIFRGGVPVNVDGCGVAIVGQETENPFASGRYIIRFSCISPDRDNVMETIYNLENQFPIYGETITIDGVATQCKAILNVASEFSNKITSGGEIKTFGYSLFEVII